LPWAGQAVLPTYKSMVGIGGKVVCDCNNLKTNDFNDINYAGYCSSASGFMWCISRPFPHALERLVHSVREFQQAVFVLINRAAAQHVFPVQHAVPILASID